jgi:hypothetical protein
MPHDIGSWATIAAVTVLIQAAKVIRVAVEHKSERPPREGKNALRVPNSSRV